MRTTDAPFDAPEAKLQRCIGDGPSLVVSALQSSAVKFGHQQVGDSRRARPPADGRSAVRFVRFFAVMPGRPRTVLNIKWVWSALPKATEHRSRRTTSKNITRATICFARTSCAPWRVDRDIFAHGTRSVANEGGPRTGVITGAAAPRNSVMPPSGLPEPAVFAIQTLPPPSMARFFCVGAVL